MPRGATATIAIIMIVLKFGDWIAPKIRKLGGSEDEKRRQEDEYATRQFNIFREIFSSLPEDCLPDDGHWRARLADKVLSCILHVVKSRIIANADSLQVTLLSFSGEHAEGLKIVSRAKDTRPSEIKRKADQTIAYYAAVTGKVVIVNDLRSQPVFPKTGLSSEKATYRSILLVPVIPHGNGHKDCVGVLTVDSPKPCEFWGDIGDNIATQLIPLVHILTVLMKSGYPRIAIEEA